MSLESLTEVVGQSEHMQVLIAQSAEGLSCVNTAIGAALVSSDPVLGMESALHANEAVIRQLRLLSKELVEVQKTLRNEIRDRTLLNLQLAASQEQEQVSRTAALHDKLTTLPNRVLFNDRLEHAIAQAKRHRWLLAVMFVDLDGFKRINDAYGHRAGDVVLQTVAMRLKHTTRADDTISRFGGDEFLCVLTQLHEKSEIAMIAAKCRGAIQAPCDLQAGDTIVNQSIEASIGIALFPQDGATASALVRRADEAMYEAKKSKSGFAFAQ